MNETAVNNFDDHSKVVSEQTRLWGPQKVQIYVVSFAIHNRKKHIP